MHVIVYDKTRLLCYNSFRYEGIQDVLDCLEHIWQGIEVSPQQCKVVFAGLIENYSKAYGFLKRYISDFELKNKITFLPNSMKYFPHIGHGMVYFDLLSSVFCYPHGSNIKY